jgi:hypothetical protein
LCALTPYLHPTNQIQMPALIRGGRLGALDRGGDGMLDGSRYFAEFPEENPDRIPLNPTVLCALVAIEREISRFVVKTEGDATDSDVRCDSESN